MSKEITVQKYNIWDRHTNFIERTATTTRRTRMGKCLQDYWEKCENGKLTKFCLGKYR